jgi:glycosylphosphatidylinositol transamidase (GPIT) subunit GPI8
MALYSRTGDKTKHLTEERYRKDEIFNAITTGIIADENKDLSIKQISKELEVDKNTSKAALIAYKDILPNLTRNRQEWYQKNRGNIFRAIEDLAAESLIQKIKAGELSGKDLTSALKTLHQLGRLEEGLSTENIAQSIQVTNKTSLPEAIKAKD